MFALVVALVLREMYLNVTYQLERQGTEMSYDFLETRAGFDIKEHLVKYNRNSDFLQAFLVAFTNALFVAIVGIVFCTLLGIVLGVARLSPNWLLRKITQIYVEIFRNVPLLVQMVFWYVGVILAIPTVDESISLLGVGFLSNTGAAIPAIRGDAGFGTWLLLVLVGIALAVAVWIWRSRLNDRTGEPSYRFTYAVVTAFVVATLAYFVLGGPFHVQRPTLERFGYSGGIEMSPEFAAGLIGLVVYTGAFIGEIVRGSILAVSKGQKEAAAALGLRPGQQLRLVVLPQAMRIALPSINNQYLNLWKNTSLLFIVGFPELINISTTMINQTGNELQIFALVVLTYLSTSLVISLLMNILNRAIAYRGVRT